MPRIGRRVHIRTGVQARSADLMPLSVCANEILSDRFRSENQKSPIHLSEFYMIEAEKSFVDSVDALTTVVEDMMKAVTRDVLNRCEADVIAASPGRCGAGDFSWLDKPFPVITYAEAVDILQRNADKIKSDVNFDDGFNKEHELFLVQHTGTPVSVVDWPKKLKPFYMKQNEQNPNNVTGIHDFTRFV